MVASQLAGCLVENEIFTAFSTKLIKHSYRVLEIQLKP